jgi:hypothetical protein
MPLVIDGYNLLHASDVFGQGPGRTSLESSRRALLDFLADHLPAKDLSDVTIVFDASGAPPGLPREEVYRGIAVRFAPRREDADAVIERLIEEHGQPQALVVVSSDHRIQRAARRRRATSIDSDVWYTQLVREAQSRPAPREVKPAPPVDPEDVARWVREFSDEARDDE